MDYYQRIAGNFQQTVELIAMSVDTLALPIEQGSTLMTEALLQDRTIMACGNGPDAALSQIFVSNLLNRFEYDRPALPALSLGTDAASLTAIATTNSVDNIFARQIHALGQTGDILLCINSGAGHDNLINAIRAAQDRNMPVIALSSGIDERFRGALGPNEVELFADTDSQPRAVELHTMIIQNLCEMIELSLFGSYDQE
ncbi:MAG: SIS domain-containing protein [Halioglobus sp.]